MSTEGCGTREQFKRLLEPNRLARQLRAGLRDAVDSGDHAGYRFRRSDRRVRARRDAYSGPTQARDVVQIRHLVPWDGCEVAVSMLVDEARVAYDKRLQRSDPLRKLR